MATTPMALPEASVFWQTLATTALAALERVKPQSLTRLLAELEAEDWIARAPHPSDGRQSVLSLTPEGTKRLKAIMRSRESALTEAIGATLDAEQRAVLLQACELIDGLSATLADEAMNAAPALQHFTGLWRHGRWRPGVQLAGAVALAWIVSVALHLPESFWAVMSVLIVMRPSAGSTLDAGWDRVRGTAAGA
eukprot:gene10090-13509_t